MAKRVQKKISLWIFFNAIFGVAAQFERASGSGSQKGTEVMRRAATSA
jgi:hypothetical protein